MAWQARTQMKRPKGTPQQTWKEGIEKILKERGSKWNRVQAIARHRDRWQIFVKPLHVPVEKVGIKELKLSVKITHYFIKYEFKENIKFKIIFSSFSKQSSVLLNKVYTTV
jgi:hypothetical protein